MALSTKITTTLFRNSNIFRRVFISECKASSRSPEAIFIEKSLEEPILVVTEKDNVDVIGPPDPVSNLRSIIRKQRLHETRLQQELREYQDETHVWNHNFWMKHNTKFIKEKQDYINTRLGKCDEKRQLTADEMSEFYKSFLDDNWSTHVKYNFDWTKLILGPKLVGPFEPSINADRTSFTTSLPYEAQYIKYYDEIGLIRSYELKYHKDNLSVDFKPRYPLHGGWKAPYSLIYLIPIHKNIIYSKVDGDLELNILANDHVLKDVLIERASIKVLLPEGSSIVAVNADSELIRRGNRKVFSSLSFNGRKQIEFEGKNILNHYDINVMVRFKQSIFYFVRVPLLITSHIFAVFFVVIFVNRYKPFGSK